MSKLKLEIEELRVESFDTHPSGRFRGTVAAHDVLIGDGMVAVPVTNDVQGCLDSWINTCVTARISECPGETCGDAVTCGASCMATCETCYGATCVTACLATCFSGGDICCA